jgi:ABC-type anion transport system duplicated permease subunit
MSDVMEVGILIGAIQALVFVGDRLWKKEKVIEQKTCPMEHAAITKDLAHIASVLVEHSTLMRELVRAGDLAAQFSTLQTAAQSERFHEVNKRLDNLDNKLAELAQQSSFSQTV